MPRGRLAEVGSHGPAVRGGQMSAPQAVSGFSALGQPTRLAIVRLLMRHEPHGLAAGAIAEELGCLQNTLSTHIGILARAGLIQGTRDSRSIIYRADIEGMRGLISFLVTDCCDGHPELCSFEAPAKKPGCGCAPSRGGRKARC